MILENGNRGFNMKNYTYLDLIDALGIGGAHPGGYLLTKSILSEEKIREETKLLDAGCGTGQTSAFLYEKFKCQIVCLDINKKLLQKAHKRFTQSNIPIQIIHGDIQKTPYQSSLFDYVLSESVLTFTNIDQSVLEIARVLKSEGYLIANEMTIEKSLSQQEKFRLQQFYGFTDFKTEEDWVNQFEKSGFEIIDIIHPNEFLADQGNGTEFDITSQINEEIFMLLDQHEFFMNTFKDVLRYRVYKVKKL